uniref:Tubulin polymerization-promoting protein family member 3 n=1 Tax=Lates calcarifer TaxID=8187 RepID=A0A4W6CRL4_LATCA
THLCTGGLTINLPTHSHRYTSIILQSVIFSLCSLTLVFKAVPPEASLAVLSFPAVCVCRQKTSRVITYEEFQRALEDLAPKRFKGQSKEEAVQSIFKLVEGREPTNVGVTKVAKTAAVDRLTDTSRYTGSHKERFDESGRGKGREGREEIVENTGYVGAYKNAGTYDTKMKAEK